MRYLIVAVMLIGFPAVSIAQDAVFGDDSSEWANDGECDDRRFTGAGMASFLETANIGRDASDCRALTSEGVLSMWSMSAAVNATQCTAINFGDDSGEYPQDGECDDSRFEGIGAASQMSMDNAFKDATDCSALCGYGAIALRNY